MKKLGRHTVRPRDEFGHLHVADIDLADVLARAVRARLGEAVVAMINGRFQLVEHEHPMLVDVGLALATQPPGDDEGAAR